VTALDLEDMTLPPDLLVRRGAGFSNPRTETGLDEESIEELACDLDKGGLIHPLLVWLDEAAGEYIILDGQRRHLAIERILERVPDHRFLDGIPCRLVRAATLEEAQAAALRTTLHRRDLSTYEVAGALARMEGTVTEIAQLVGRSTGYVSLLLTAWTAPPEALEHWRKGDIDHRQAYAAARAGAQPPASLLDDTVPDRATRPSLREMRAELQRLYTALDRANGMARQRLKGQIAALEWVCHGKTMEE
jgi:ParB-like chromosome segregation protein Spo0J